MSQLYFLYLCFFLFLPVCCLFAENLNTNNVTSVQTNEAESFSATLVTIKRGDFMKPGGVEKLMRESSGINVVNKELLFSENQKSWAWGCLDYVVPSLGNWIEGDYLGQSLFQV